jgi:hypothetical protein
MAPRLYPAPSDTQPYARVAPNQGLLLAEITSLKDVEKSENKRIILTTRGYILEQARQAHERLERFDFGNNTYILDLEDYRDSARAAILYTNVYFSSLTDECKAAFASSEVYLLVIRHSNYNPRLIENTIDLAVRDALSHTGKLRYEALLS